MGGGAVSLVFVPRKVRIFLVKLVHESIPCDFGNNGCNSNGGTLCIAPDDGKNGVWSAESISSIQEYSHGRKGQGAYCFFHGRKGRMKYMGLKNILHGAMGDGPGGVFRVVKKNIIEKLSPVRGKFFRVL